MEDHQLSSRLRVRNACARLVYELDIEVNRKNPYFLPYTNYVMSWCDHIPIHTIIIGQNPYPQVIYPEYGAAFAYDDRKLWTTNSVEVLSKDLQNYDGTNVSVSRECFKNSWRLLEIGVVLINETVYDKISKRRRNTGAIREMEAQFRALQVLLTESYFMGQTTMTCIGMGISAACMSSIARSWNPKDLFKMRVMTCKNPAARDIGDMPSHQITIGKTAVSKVLSQIVKSYINMPPFKNTAQDKRRKQNANALKEGADNVSVTADQYANEIQSFEERLRSSREGGVSSSSLDEILQSSGSLRKAIDKHKNAIMSYNITLLMIVEAIDRVPQNQDNVKPSSTPSTTNSTIVGRPGGARRRVVRKTTDVTQVDSVPELPETETEVKPEPKQENVTPSPAPSRARRRAVPRVSSYAQSNAGTEYTMVSTQGPLETKKGQDMSQLESVIMKVFADWCNNNSADPVSYELLYNAADTMMVLSPLVNDLVMYIRKRKSEDPEYDAFDELSDPDSPSSTWAKQNIISSS
jgi:hypothetical protein